MQVWNRRGALYPGVRGLDRVKEILAPLPVGMCVEGEFVRKDDCIYLFDITFVPPGFANVEAYFAEENRTVKQRPNKYFYPPAPAKTSRDHLLTLPPDDYILQCKKDVDRVFAFHPKNRSVDIRPLEYEHRFSILQDWLSEVQTDNLQLIPYVTSNFPAAYEKWRSEAAEGVVAKRLNSPYQSSPTKTEETQHWLKRRYIWDDQI